MISGLETLPVTCKQLNKGILMHVKKSLAQVKDQYSFQIYLGSMYQSESWLGHQQLYPNFMLIAFK